MIRPQLTSIHIHGAPPPARPEWWLRVRPLSLVRPRYLVITSYSDGAVRRQAVRYPQRDWWVITALMLTPPWTAPRAAGCPPPGVAHAHEADL